MVPVIAAAITVAAGCYKDGFQCGVPLESDDSVIRRCNRPQEVCVCATLSCAQLDKSCSSGWRYGDGPFLANAKLAGLCVSDEDAAGHLIDHQTVALCESVDASAAMQSVPDGGE